MWSEAIKILKGEYTVRAIKEHKMDQAIIFCRTKIDCDNMEQYFIQQGGGNIFHKNLTLLTFLFISEPKLYDGGHWYLDTTQIKLYLSFLTYWLGIKNQSLVAGSYRGGLCGRKQWTALYLFQTALKWLETTYRVPKFESMKRAYGASAETCISELLGQETGRNVFVQKCMLKEMWEKAQGDTDRQQWGEGWRHIWRNKESLD